MIKDFGFDLNVSSVIKDNDVKAGVSYKDTTGAKIDSEKSGKRAEDVFDDILDDFTKQYDEHINNVLKARKKIVTKDDDKDTIESLKSEINSLKVDNDALQHRIDALLSEKDSKSEDVSRKRDYFDDDWMDFFFRF